MHSIIFNLKIKFLFFLVKKKDLKHFCRNYKMLENGNK